MNKKEMEEGKRKNKKKNGKPWSINL